MRNYFVFMKKEIVENIRTKRLHIILAAFIFLGILAPFTAKLTPAMFKMMSSDLEKQGIVIKNIQVSALDSWTQFYKNVPLMATVIIIIMFSGILTNELNKGTLVNILTKGLKRSTVILSKFTVASLVWTISFWCAAVITYGYTMYFWGSEGTYNVLFSLLCVWIFGVMIISLLILGNSFINSGYGVMLFTVIVIGVLYIINIIPKLGKFNPIMLVTGNMSLIDNTSKVSDYRMVILVSLIIVVVSLVASIRIFNKK